MNKNDNSKIISNPESIIIFLNSIGFTNIEIENNKIDGILGNIKCFNIALDKLKKKH